MRRFGSAVLGAAVICALSVTVGAGPAAAHVCPQPVQIPVGQQSTVAVGVTVESATVPDVEIGFPDGLRLDRIAPKEGWTPTRRGATVRLRGGPIAPFTCEYFSFRVTATARGTYGITVVQRTADGTVVARVEPNAADATDRVLDQFVYAGVKPPSTGGSGGLSAATLAGIALVGAGILLAAGLVVRRRLVRPDELETADGDAGRARAAELRARIERFKERAPDRRAGE